MLLHLHTPSRARLAFHACPSVFEEQNVWNETRVADEQKLTDLPRDDARKNEWCENHMYEEEPEHPENEPHEGAGNHLTCRVIQQINATEAHEQSHNRAKNYHNGSKDSVDRRVIM